jgi:effector-binding domain-containing protein
MESEDNKGEKRRSDSKFNQEIHSQVVRAGKRTYFFDVKSTRKEEYYLTITESKKRYEDNGNFHYEKHKIFLYKEDFEKFADCLESIISYINEHQTEAAEPAEEEEIAEGLDESKTMANSSNVDFEDI